MAHVFLPSEELVHSDETSREKDSNTETDQPPPMLVEQMESRNDHQHVVDITRNDDSSFSSSHDDQSREIDLHHYDDGLSSSTSVSTYQTTSSSTHTLNFRNSMVTRRTNDRSGPRRRSPLNSVIWISVELLVSVGQIIASIVVLSMSRNENPQAPLFAWVMGYTSGCVATLPVLYWRFLNRNQSPLQDSAESRQGSFHNNAPESTSYMAISVNPASDEEAYGSTVSATRNDQVARLLSSRLNGLMDHLKMALDIFFAVWFIVGNVWIFGGHTTPTDAPKLYRLCIVLLTFSCIGYAMPFILCATICCCLPCIISLLGFPEDFSQARGATAEFINTLPIYKFKIKDHENTDDPDHSEEAKGGVLAAGKENERFIPGEDAVCCICLNIYIDNDALRELSCSHVFHVDCVDKWLKINASCPLCKTDVYESTEDSGQS